MDIFTKLTTLDTSQSAKIIEDRQLEDLIKAVSPRLSHNLADWIVYKHVERAYGNKQSYNCIAPFALFNKGPKDLFGGYSLSLTHFLDKESFLFYYDANALRMLDYDYWGDVEEQIEAGDPNI
ncbi:hypothetical protein SYK_32290 [Pseudodesulfovibrio nedwellii]|uniref:Uncharacterized protein n=1 Tax=Pseudodesulfovibrio nedwellii TaxID=2973072 RepID=A0ABM8B4W9_9BACT|nr:hypothetical protein [Pseudodesulfovibrio nedwellii]BDQ38869.1 hypothetical protein SYK_32290 [Pseudodesulfovibrio nedwellii]